MKNLLLSHVSPTALKPLGTLTRKHSKSQIKAISRSIQEFGWTVPILVDQQNRVVAGWARVQAAKLLSLKLVPTIQMSHLSEAQLKAYAIADNKLAELASWDNEGLTIEFKVLEELKYDLQNTGFEIAEIDQLLAADIVSDAADDLPPLDSNKPTSNLGDVWALGHHRVICADATKPESYSLLLGTTRAQAVITDPPYNVPIAGHVTRKRQTKHREFAMAAGEMSSEAFSAFLRTIMQCLVSHTADGALHYLFMDWRHSLELLQAALPIYTQYVNLVVWDKTNGGMGPFYRSKHELVHVFKSGTKAHINNVNLGKHGRNRNNVWNYAGVNSFKEDRKKELEMHPTVKPVAMIADAILDCTTRNGAVLDPFAGSGTTVIAAQETERRAFAMEIDPHYVDIIVTRWQHFSKLKATLQATGETFEAVCERRTSLQAAE